MPRNVAVRRGRPRRRAVDGLARARWRALRALRIADAPVTQAALARCLGCSQPYVSTLLNGSGTRSHRSWTMEQRFAALVGRPHDTLFPPHPDHPDDAAADAPEATAAPASADRRSA